MGRIRRLQPRAPPRRARGGLCAVASLTALAAWSGAGRNLRCLVTVTGLYRYPVKSCLGEELARVEVTPGGLLGDRTHAVCLGGSRGLTQRECPRLAAITAELTAEGALRLHAGGTEPLELPASAGGTPADSMASVLGATVDGIDLGDEAAEWVTAASGMGGCRLLRRAEGCRRQAVGAHWADLAPLLVISEASMDELARRAGRGVPLDRFRPNLLVASDSGEPHEEDKWRRIRVGGPDDGVLLEAVGPCARCSIIEVDQDAAARDKSFSVYGVLAGYRSPGGGQVVFGSYFKPVLKAGAAPPAIEVGAEVTVLQ